MICKTPNLTVLSLILACLGSLSASAVPGGSGGGDVVVMPKHGDDSVRLADPCLAKALLSAISR